MNTYTRTHKNDLGDKLERVNEQVIRGAVGWLSYRTVIDAYVHTYGRMCAFCLEIGGNNSNEKFKKKY